MVISEEILIQSIESSNLAHTISLMNDDLTLSYVNQAFLDQTGYSRDEVIGKNCRFLQGKNTDKNTVKKIGKALKNLEPIDLEILNYKKDGTPFWNHLKIAPVFDTNKNPIAFIGIQSDVTHVRKEERIRAEKYKLETLGRVSANISHEIKNAIQPIKLMSEILLDWENFSKEQTEKYINIINENVKITDSIVNDVLRFSRKNDETTSIISTDEITSDIIRFVKNIIAPAIKFNHDINIEKECSVLINVSQLLQVIVNIVNNACYAMENKGNLEVNFKIEEISNFIDLENGKYFSVSITDDGKGMDDEVKKSVFQPFYTTKPIGVGTGLGLSISQNIIKDWSGLITCESEKGIGTCFKIMIPIVN